jgi:Zn-dependent protease
MNGFLAGRIAGLPVTFDTSFALLVAMLAPDYLRAESREELVIGLLILSGGIASILLHELAHATAGRRCGVTPLFIELHGFGGACHFNQRPNKREQRVFVSLAGPMANFILWVLLGLLASGTRMLVRGPLTQAVETGSPDGALNLLFALYLVFSTLSSFNLGLFVFNLLPSFPLDGGKALSEYLSGHLDPASAIRIVAILGYGVCVWCLYLAFTSHGLWSIILAYSLFLANQQALANASNQSGPHST